MQFEPPSLFGRKKQIPFWNLLGRKLRHGRVPIYRNPNDKSIAFRRSSGFGFTVHQPGNRILRKFRMDLFSHTKAYSIISPLDLIKIFASRQPDISGEWIDCQSRRFNHALQSSPGRIIRFFIPTKNYLFRRSNSYFLIYSFFGCINLYQELLGPGHKMLWIGFCTFSHIKWKEGAVSIYYRRHWEPVISRLSCALACPSRRNEQGITRTDNCYTWLL